MLHCIRRRANQPRLEFSRKVNSRAGEKTTTKVATFDEYRTTCHLPDNRLCRWRHIYNKCSLQQSVINLAILTCTNTDAIFIKKIRNNALQSFGARSRKSVRSSARFVFNTRANATTPARIPNSASSVRTIQIANVFAFRQTTHATQMIRVYRPFDQQYHEQNTQM